MVVDDWIPCESRGRIAFSTSKKGNELWVSILEKDYVTYPNFEKLCNCFILFFETLC